MNNVRILKKLLIVGTAMLLLLLSALLFSWESTYAGQVPATSGTALWALNRWPPYAAGIGIGILSWLVFLLSDNTLGASGAYAKSAGMVETIIRGSQVMERRYYRENPPKIGWGWMLLIGIVLGAFISALLGNDFKFNFVPDFWHQQMESGVFSRWLTAIAGGILLGIGSRWADGCTSGHGISGTMQLVVSSWVAVICFFIGGTVTAQIFY